MDIEVFQELLCMVEPLIQWKSRTVRTWLTNK